LWLNLKVGFQGWFNVCLLTLPGCGLWLFAWYDGWNNSFNKGYEQAAVGPVTGWLGIVLFIAAMFYVPVAQARQASTGQWTSFFHFGMVRRLIRRRWLAVAGLAGLYASLSLPVYVLKTVPAFYPKMNAAWNDLAPASAAAILDAHFFWSCLYVFPVFVLLRLVAGRVYASALWDAVRGGTLDAEDLAPIERRTFERLGLLGVDPVPPRPAVWRVLTWAGTRAGRLAAGGVAALLWFSLVAQVFVAEFLNYHPGVGWLHQPTVHTPWFHYVPKHLTEP
jgi:hypothetical protein